MYELVSGIINNIFFIMFPILIYQVFYYENKSTFFKNDKVTLTILFSISTTLCVFFPYHIMPNEGYLFDLRQVPLIIGTLYGGYTVGAILFVISAIVRIFIGGDGVYMALLNQFMIFAFVPLLQNHFFKLSHLMRVFAISVVAALSLIFNAVAGVFIYNDSIMEIWDVWAIIILNQFVVTALTALVIERIIKNSYIQQNLLKNEKLDVVSHFSASIAHEIRNPLTSN